MSTPPVAEQDISILDVDKARKIHFKHVYGTNINEWGIIGFPKSQTATTAGRKYLLGDLVLLAIPRDPKIVVGVVSEEAKGAIFGVCTLAVIARPTSQIANPEMVRRYPDVVEQWDTALPIIRAWRFKVPRRYETFGANQELVKLARIRRGQLIRVPDAIVPEVQAWLAQAPCVELPLTYAEPTKEILREMKLIPL